MRGFPKDAAVPTGMRRNCWVRILVDEHGTHCELLGVGHRLPSVRPISLDTALALSAAGVPTVVRSVDRAAESLLATG